MNKRYFLLTVALIVALIVASGAVASYAQEKMIVEKNLGVPVPAPTPSPGAAPLLAVPAPAATAEAIPAPTAATGVTVAAPEGCKFVRLTRPDIDPDNNEVYITFRGYGGTVEAIDACNPDNVMKPGGSTVFGVVTSPTAGARVSIRTHDGSGVVGLPTAYVDGNTHQVHCKVVDGKLAFDFYKFTWKGGLPDSIDMRLEKMADDKGMAICNKAVTPDQRAKLEKKI